MELVELTTDEASLRRYAEELWVPYNRELTQVVERFELADDVDLIAEQIPFRRERLTEAGDRAWVAVDTDEPPARVADADNRLAGFITSTPDECPSVFQRPDRLKIGDFYVRESYRSTGLATRLVERVVQQAQADGCGDVTLDVDVDNERAKAFYDKLGFEPHRQERIVGVGRLERRLEAESSE